MRIILGADHGGFALKNELVSRLKDKFNIYDAGAITLNPDDDYPDIAYNVAREIASSKAERGILICGSGVGACITSNKIQGVRACLCHDTYSAHQGVEHDNMNILCLGARVIGTELAYELAISFLNATFSLEERHRRRVQRILEIERSELRRGGKEK